MNNWNKYKKPVEESARLITVAIIFNNSIYYVWKFHYFLTTYFSNAFYILFNFSKQKQFRKNKFADIWENMNMQ